MSGGIFVGLPAEAVDFVGTESVVLSEEEGVDEAACSVVGTAGIEPVGRQVRMEVATEFDLLRVDGSEALHRFVSAELQGFSTLCERETSECRMSRTTGAVAVRGDGALARLAERPVPMRQEPPDPIGQGRMRGEKMGTEGAAKEEMTGVPGHGVGYGGPGGKAADFHQGTGDAVGVAGELYGRGVGEELPLPRDGGLDEIRKEGSHVPDEEQPEPADEHDEGGTAALLATRTDVGTEGTAKDDLSDEGDKEDAEEKTHETDVQPHVAVEDVRKFVGDNALQFVAGEQGHAAAGDADDGVAG